MKIYKYLVLFIVFFLIGCTPKNQEVPITKGTIITMDNLDEFMFRDDVQYVDLRNMSQKFNSGFIKSFELIPFFDFLDYRAFDRNNSFDFNENHILDVELIETFFDRDKAIFLYADGCIRSGYMSAVLSHLGYERVFVLGPYYEYDGDYKIFGNGDYHLGDEFYTSIYDKDSELTYLMYGKFDLDRKIMEIHFDVLNKSEQSLRTKIITDINYDEQLTILEQVILREFVTFNELYDYINNEESDFYNIENFHLGYPDGLIKLIEEKNIVRN
ncbi:MAG: rhodanese-like domain-containing protein [Candidatus Izimaplasma sp.]|nr:rhodanese-like domain-containing protein [Candidatus Izimaplasma bacterium]